MVFLFLIKVLLFSQMLLSKNLLNQIFLYGTAWPSPNELNIELHTFFLEAGASYWLLQCFSNFNKPNLSYKGTYIFLAD